jgi:hypothetical protein
MVRSFKDHQRCELDYKKNEVEPVISDKDWIRTLENIREYLATTLGVKGSPLVYVASTDVAVPEAAEGHAEGYLMLEQDIIHRAPHSGPAFRNDRCTAWNVMSKIRGQHE